MVLDKTDSCIINLTICPNIDIYLYKKGKNGDKMNALFSLTLCSVVVVPQSIIFMHIFMKYQTLTFDPENS